ncbi:MAG: hypothetical protein ACE5QF_02005 [Thermoplasmata archaeon]
MTTSVARWETTLEAYDARFTLRKEELLAKEFRLRIGGRERRCLLYYSADKAERDRKAREERLARAESGLREIQDMLKRKGPGRRHTRQGLRRRIDRLLEKNLCRNLIHWRFVGGRGGRRMKWERKEEAMREAELRDGKYWLITTLDSSAEEVLRIYRSRAAVERAFRRLEEASMDMASTQAKTTASTSLLRGNRPWNGMAKRGITSPTTKAASSAFVISLRSFF